MKQLQGFLLALAFVCLSSSIYAKECEKKEVASPTDWAKLRGVWYLHKSFGMGWFNTFSRCVEDTFVLKNDVTYSRIRSYTTRIIPISHQAENDIEPTGTSDFILKSNGFFSHDQPVTFLASDYANYTILWSCESGWFSTSESSWILTKEREPKFNLLEAEIKAELQKYGFSLDQYGDAIQSSC